MSSYVKTLCHGCKAWFNANTSSGLRPIGVVLKAPMNRNAHRVVGLEIDGKALCVSCVRESLLRVIREEWKLV